MAEGAILLPERDLGAYANLPDVPNAAPPMDRPSDVPDLGAYADLPDTSPTPATDRETGSPDLGAYAGLPDKSQLGDYAALPDVPKPIGAATATALAESPTEPPPPREEIRAPEARDQARLLLSGIERLTDKLFEPGQPSGAAIISPETAAVPTSIFAGGARTAAKILSSVTGEPKYTEAAKGAEETVAQAISGFTDLDSIAGLLSFAVPGVAETYAVNVLSKLPDQFGHLKDTIKEHGLISKESAIAATQAGIQDLMGFLAGHGAKLTKLNKPAAPGSAKDLMQKRVTGKESPIAGPALVGEKGNIVASGPIGATHADLMRAAIGTPHEEAVMEAFGKDESHKFLDTAGNIWDREPAASIAVRAGQVPETVTKLQSEDLIKGGEPPSATEKGKVAEDIRQKPEDRVEGGQAQEAGVSDRIQPAAEVGPEEVAGVGVVLKHGNEPGLLQIAMRRSKDGQIVSGPDMNHAMLIDRLNLPKEFDEIGFTDAAGNFYNRAEAAAFTRGVMAEPISEPTSAELGKETPVGASIAPPPVEPHVVETGAAMGAAKFGEVERGREPVAMFNAAVDARRRAEGRDQLFSEARQADELSWDQAMARIDRNPNAPAVLVDAINAGEVKAASPIEQMMLLHEELRLQNEKTIESVRARDDSLGEDLQAEHRANYAAAERRLDATEQANRKYGTIAGRALRARRVAAFDDFTLAAMETRKRNAKGGPLTEAESLKIEQQAAEIEKLKADLAARPDVDAIAVMKTLLAEQMRETKAAAKAGKGFVETLHSARDAALKRSAERRRQGRLYSGVDPEALLDAVIIGASHIADGLRDLGSWSSAMIRDLGEGVREHLDDLFKRAKQYHQASEKAGKPKEKPPAIDKVSKASEAGKPLSQKMIYDLMREHINDGLVEGMEPNAALDTLVQAVKDDVAELFPDVTPREIRDAFTEYGKQQIPSKEKDLAQLRELRRLGQLRSAIEDVISKERPRKTGLVRDKPTQAIREKMKELNDAMREAGFESTGPEQLASRNVARETALKNQIADIEKELATGERRKPGAQVPDSEAVRVLRARRDALRKQLEEVRRADPGFDAAQQKARLARYKTYLDRRMADIKERIKAGDYVKREKVQTKLDKEAKDKQFQLMELQKEFNQGVLLDKLKHRTRGEKIWDGFHQTSNLARNAITSFDLSGVLRQGGFIVLGHPLRGAEGIGPMLRAFSSEKRRFEVMEGIRNDPNYGFSQQAQLFIGDERNISMLQQEEAYMGRWAQVLAKLPKKAVVGIPFKAVVASERAYTTFLNKLRMDSFNAMIQTLGRGGHEITLSEAKVIAHYINVATGRGGLTGGKLAAATANLNGVFFAPRYVASRFQLLMGEPMWRGSKLTRDMIAKEYARAFAGLLVVYGLGKLAGGTIETDKRSVDFGKIRFGNTRLDPMFGLSNTAVFIARGITKRESKTQAGKIVPLSGKIPFGGQTLDDVWWRFLRSKLSPAAGAAFNILREEDVVGNPVTPMSELFHNITPLAFQDVSKAMQDQGIAKGTALGVLAIFGMGLQTYTPRNKDYVLPKGTTTSDKSLRYQPAVGAP